MNRARSRRRGKRKEIEKKMKLERAAMWRKLTDTEHKHIFGKLAAGYFYCPYVPIARPQSFIVDTGA